ncbi:hypothetical protein QBC45DRAFT_10089 [Copromyces sp. CBS 386.78]|nr:hypothetical protein QBC45DRAFT_10089 [Copromyces sp. CBS 386.78]
MFLVGGLLTGPFLLFFCWGIFSPPLSPLTCRLHRVTYACLSCLTSARKTGLAFGQFRELLRYTVDANMLCLLCRYVSKPFLTFQLPFRSNKYPNNQITKLTETMTRTNMQNVQLSLSSPSLTFTLPLPSPLFSLLLQTFQVSHHNK